MGKWGGERERAEGGTRGRADKGPFAACVSGTNRRKCLPKAFLSALAPPTSRRPGGTGASGAGGGRGGGEGGGAGGGSHRKGGGGRARFFASGVGGGGVGSKEGGGAGGAGGRRAGPSSCEAGYWVAALAKAWTGVGAEATGGSIFLRSWLQG